MILEDMRLHKLRHNIIFSTDLHKYMFIFLKTQFTEDISKQNYFLLLLLPLLSLSSATIIN